MPRDRAAPAEITAAATRAAQEEKIAAAIRAVSAETIAAAIRAVSAETIEAATRAASADAAQDPDRVPAAQELPQRDARAQDPAWRKADAAEQPDEPVKERLSAEKLRSTETIIRER